MVKFEFNNKKLKKIKEQVNIIAGNLNDEIRLNLKKLEELEKLSFQSYQVLDDGQREHITTCGLAEQKRIKDQTMFLQSQQNNLYELIKSI